MGLLNGKVAVITGAGAGIGREYALYFAREGAKVVVNDIGGSMDGTGSSGAVAEKVCQEIRAAGGEAVPNFDAVGTMQSGASIVKTALDAFGRIDILVNNAGILRDKSFPKMDEESFDLVIRIHLKGAFSCAQPAFIAMREKGEGGRIINVSSLAGLIGNFGQANYGSAKAGIAGFTRVLAIEGQRFGITCNAIAPVAYTRMTSNLPMFQAPEVDKMLSPEWVAPLGVFLASELSAGVTGKIFGVQGGKLFEYKMMTTEGVVKDRFWTPQEIAAELPNIMKL